MSDEKSKQPSKKAAKKSKKIQIADANDDAQSDANLNADGAKDTKKTTISVSDFADDAKEKSVPEQIDAQEDTSVVSTVDTGEVEQSTSEELGLLDEQPDDQVVDDESTLVDDLEIVEDTANKDDSATQETVEELQHDAEVIAESESQMQAESEKTIEEAMLEAKIKEEHDVFEPDPVVDKAVDEIVRAEGDTAIATEDSKLAIVETVSKREKIKRFFVAWWTNHYARYGTIAVVIATLVAVTVIPVARYAVLNTLGVRVQASLTVVDDQTRLPLKNISVSLQNTTMTTDEQGMVAFTGLKQGNSDLIITKRGYADTASTEVLGWGSNPLGAKGIIATGEQYKFALTDWLTKEPITDSAEAVAGENSASADESGVITLTIGEENLSEVEISISADSYRSETYTIADLEAEVTKVAMVTSRKHAFISNRDGRYDLYSIDLDGMNEKIIVEATEKERDVPALLHHPTRNIAGFVSSRSGITNDDGFKLDEFYIVNTESGDLVRVARSEQLKLIGWVDDTVLFSQVVEGTSAGNPERSKLLSYNERTKERVELASANYFNDVELVGDTLYYAVSSFAVPQSKAKLYSVPAKGGESEIVLNNQVWNLFRVAYDTVHISALDQKWYELQDGSVNPIDIQPAPFSRKFIDSPSGTTAAWVEVRDGKGTVLTTDTNTKEERVVFATPGLSELLYWTNETTLVYRVTSSSETADYVLPIAEEETPSTPIKIRDVTANQRYYY